MIYVILVEFHSSLSQTSIFRISLSLYSASVCRRHFSFASSSVCTVENSACECWMHSFTVSGSNCIIIFSERNERLHDLPFLDNGRYAECISSGRSNAISCKSRRARSESDRLLNYQRLGARCLIIALTPSRNTGLGVLPFLFFFFHFFLRAFTKRTWALLRRDCDAQRRLESDFAILRGT